MSIVTGHDPEFEQGCGAMGTSDNGEMPTVSETQCGTYTILVAKEVGGWPSFFTEI